MNMDKYFMWILYERLHNHNKAKHNKTVCIFLGIHCMFDMLRVHVWDTQKIGKYYGDVTIYVNGVHMLGEYARGILFIR